MKKSVVSRLVIICLTSSLFEETATLRISDTLTVNLPQGTIKGSYDWFKNQRMFLGIPYASVAARFEEAGSPPSWNGTLIADRGNIACNQYFSALRKPIGQEDCLVLNIYTPPSSEQKRYPVMVFIHGGGFYWGSNSELIYNPTFLVKEDVIVVTLNYRLGAFGFLCLGLEEAPGNIGLKDLIAGLRWVQNNIAYFGGDPNSVTVFGESAGAVAVHYFLLSQSADGLFHRAIMQSGSVMIPQAYSYGNESIESASMVAARLGYNTTNPNELLKIFRNITADEIIKASHVDTKNNALGPSVFKPCMETAVTNRKALITKQPRQLLTNPGLNVSVINGFNDREGIYFASSYDFQKLETVKANFDSIIPNYLLFENENDKQAFSDNVYNIYFNGTVTNGLIEYFTDSVIAFPAIVSLEHLYKEPSRKVYNYYFKYDSFRNLNKFLTKLPTTPGACHADELFYMFQPVVVAALPSTPNDAAMIKTMSTFWTNFAKTGDPSTSKTTWRYSEEELQFLEINKDLKMITLPNEERMNFWRQSYEKYGRR